MNCRTPSEPAASVTLWFHYEGPTEPMLSRQKSVQNTHREVWLSFARHPEHKKLFQADRLSGLRVGFSTLYSKRPKLTDVA